VRVTLEVDAWEIEHHRETYGRMLARLCEALARRDLVVTFELSSTRATFAPRTSPHSGFRIAWHSIGEEPDVWRVKDAAIPGYYLFDRTGFSGWAEIGRYPQRFKPLIDQIDAGVARSFVKNLRRTLVERNVSKFPQSDRAFASPGPFVFFPLQLLDDAVVALQRFSTLDVLDRAAALARDKRKYLVIKRHPHCLNESVASGIARVSRGNEYVLHTDASIHAILRACDAVLVANSGVGFEALIHHRPVYTFGGSEYELITQKLATLEDVGSAFASSHEIDSDLTDRYLTYFLRQNCFSPEDIGGMLRHLDVAMGEASRGRVADADSGKDALQLKLLETSALLEKERRRVIALEAKLAVSWLFSGRVSQLFLAGWRRISRRWVTRRNDRFP
jgi:capsular polysaccharide biosynthesis protein